MTNSEEQSAEKKRFGRYEIVEELGHGAMGKVYLGRDPKIDRLVAIKTISFQDATAAEEQEDRQRFIREAHAAGKLAHPGIVTIHDVGEDEETHTPFIVMEYIPGRTLEDCMRGDPLTLETALELMKQVAEALEYAHAQGIIHRDIKPANIIVTSDGRAKITDFGLARVRESKLTRPGQVLGTPSHVSPEQLRGEPLTGRSDLFSLGVMLYTLLTGERPFAAETVAEVVLQVAFEDPVAVTVRNPALRPEFDYVLARLLAKDPERRYQHAQELANDLGDLKLGRPVRWLAGTSVVAPAAGRGEAGSGSFLLNTSDVDQTLRAIPETAAAPVPAPRIERLPVRKSPPAEPSSTATGIPVPFSTLPPAAQPAARARRRWLLPLAALLTLLLMLGGWAASRGRWGNPDPITWARLRFSFTHNFQAADYSIWVDNDRMLSGSLSEHDKDLASTVSVRSGQHIIRVRITAAKQQYDETREIQANLPPGGELNLHVAANKSGKELQVELR